MLLSSIFILLCVNFVACQFKHCATLNSKIYTENMTRRVDSINIASRMDKYYRVEVDKPKSLMCCVPDDFTSIIWYFDGTLLKDETRSTFRVDTRDARIIRSQRVNETRDIKDTRDIIHGKIYYYKCEVTFKDHQSISHTFNLIAANKHNTPNINNLESHSFKTTPGKTVLLVASIFVGIKIGSKPNNQCNKQINQTKIQWMSNSSKYNEVLNKENYSHEDKIVTEDNIMTFISIRVVELDTTLKHAPISFNFYFKIPDCSTLSGNYIYSDNPEPPVNVPPITIVCTIFSAIMISIAIFLTVLYYNIEIRLIIVIIKQQFGPPDVADDQTYDIFVMSTTGTNLENNETVCDSDVFSTKILVPYLEQVLGYTCYDFWRDTNGGDYVPDTILRSLQASRRLILVLSDKMLEDAVCKLVCQAAVNEALSRKLTIICIQPEKTQRQVLLQKCQETTSMVSLLAVAQKVTWHGKKSTLKQNIYFWRSLQLYLPVKNNIFFLKSSSFIELNEIHDSTT